MCLPRLGVNESRLGLRVRMLHSYDREKLLRFRVLKYSALPCQHFNPLYGNEVQLCKYGYEVLMK